jgi:hypothetical protein
MVWVLSVANVPGLYILARMIWNLHFLKYMQMFLVNWPNLSTSPPSAGPCWVSEWLVIWNDSRGLRQPFKFRVRRNLSESSWDLDPQSNFHTHRCYIDRAIEEIQAQHGRLRCNHWHQVCCKKEQKDTPVTLTFLGGFSCGSTSRSLMTVKYPDWRGFNRPKGSSLERRVLGQHRRRPSINGTEPKVCTPWRDSWNTSQSSTSRIVEIASGMIQSSLLACNLSSCWTPRGPVWYFSLPAFVAGDLPASIWGPRVRRQIYGLDHTSPATPAWHHTGTSNDIKANSFWKFRAFRCSSRWCNQPMVPARLPIE